MWPHPSCNWRDEVHIQNTNWKFSLFSQPGFKFQLASAVPAHLFHFACFFKFLLIFILCWLRLHVSLPQVCDCKRVFFEGLTATDVSIHERSQRNIVLPILLERNNKLRQLAVLTNFGDILKMCLFVNKKKS